MYQECVDAHGDLVRDKFIEKEGPHVPYNGIQRGSTFLEHSIKVCNDG